MLASTFKKYDIRGVVGDEFTLEKTYRLTQAIAHYFLQQQPTMSTVIVGMDGRVHSPAIQSEVCKALQDAGLHVYFLGTCPTPLFYFANHILNAQAGIMITASHNPKEYNGLKLMLNKKSVFDQEIMSIKDWFFSETVFPQSQPRGIFYPINIIETYVNLLAERFAHLKNISIKAVIDCAHGATAVIIPRLVEAMAWQNVEILCGTIDGTFPAHEADPTKEKNMLDVRKTLEHHDGYFGIGFDGDGDRMGAVTQKGALLKGDELSALFCHHLRQHGPFTAIVDIKCSNALLEQFKAWDINTLLTPCGIGFVRQAMRTNQALFGGELSCHFCFSDRYFGYDDGIYAMMRLIELCQETPLQEQYDQLPPHYCSPDVRLECSHERKHTIIAALHAHLAEQPEIQINTLDGIRASMAHGCVSIRPSNTEPLLSARFEGTSQENLDRIIDDFYILLLPHFEESYLKKMLSRG